MSYKSWTFRLFVYCILLLVAIESKYQIFEHYKNRVDWVVNNIIANKQLPYHDIVIIGDSLASNAFNIIKLHKNILDITTISPVYLAGNYFILKRYIHSHKPPKKIFLFTSLPLLYASLDDNLSYAYFESIFTKEDEKNEIKKLKPYLYDEFFSVDKYFENRKHALSIGYKPPKRIAMPNITKSELKAISDYTNKKIQNKINLYTTQKEIVNKFSLMYLNKIIKLCKDNDIEFSVVIEPMANEYDEIFRDSAYNKLLASNENIKYYNVNDYYSFSAYFFRHDGLHIRGKVNLYFLKLVDEHILDIY